MVNVPAVYSDKAFQTNVVTSWNSNTFLKLHIAEHFALGWIFPSTPGTHERYLLSYFHSLSSYILYFIK